MPELSPKQAKDTKEVSRYGCYTPVIGTPMVSLSPQRFLKRPEPKTVSVLSHHGLVSQSSLYWPRGVCHGQILQSLLLQRFLTVIRFSQSQKPKHLSSKTPISATLISKLSSSVIASWSCFSYYSCQRWSGIRHHGLQAPCNVSLVLELPASEIPATECKNNATLPFYNLNNLISPQRTFWNKKVLQILKVLYGTI